ncbi:MAG: DNA-binding transcriptional regulator [Lentisphaeria bacterium]|nr:DNA-binding transcriptional regulator [Lentisphaeria bacterium]
MSNSAKPVRVALMGSRHVRDMLHDITLGVVAYKRGAAHWQLVGSAERPMLTESEVDLKAIDGLIGFFNKPQWGDTLREAGVTAVNISSKVEDLPLPRVGSDDEAVGRMGGEHLLACGFAHFGFFDVDRGWFALRRLAGFADVVEGQAGRTCHVFPAIGPTSDLSAVIGRWLAALPKPAGVMAASDFLGRALIQQALALGFRVPDDVAVLGVNNDSWLTELATVPMSSIELNAKDIGYEAAKMLDGLMAGEVHQRALWIPPVGVVPRQSTDIVIADDPVVGPALAYIRDHCHKGIRVEDVANVVHVSRRTLEARLKRALGYTPQVAIQRARVNRARKMLIETDATMSRIAVDCGFGCESRFFIVFKRETGMTPGQYRRQY